MPFDRPRKPHRKERCPTENNTFTARNARRLIPYRPRRLARREAPSLFRLLLPSVLGVCVCSLLLLGSTWAWFSAAARSDVGAVRSAEIFTKKDTTSQTQTLAGLDELSNEAMLALVAPEGQTFAAYAADTEPEGQTFAAYAADMKLDIAPYDAAQTDLALLAQARAENAAPAYDLLTVTLTAEGTVSKGYFAVTYNGTRYYSHAVKPGDQVSFTVGRELYDAGYQRGDFAVEACWGARPANVPTLDDLEMVCAQDFDDFYLAPRYEQYLTALQMRYSALVAEEIGRAEEMRRAEEARLAEEAAAQQGTEDSWPQEDAGAFYFLP